MNRSLFPLLLFCFLAASANANVTLPKIFSDNMVLQRDVPLKIWGWADPGESVSVSFNGASVRARSDKSGYWSTVLKPMAHGGPYEMKISGKSGSITLKNILIGDVWLGSGQSNMEWTVKNSNNAVQEIARGNYPRIRLFTVKQSMSYEPQQDLSGGQWLECTSANVGDFSAVAYFFGRRINEELDIPVGLINSSWGGTNIQTWISWDVMGKKEEYKDADLMKLQEAGRELAGKQKKFDQAMKNEPGLSGKWFDPSASVAWKPIMIPKMWEQTEIGNADGYVWFKKEFILNEEPNESSQAQLSLGPIDDQDWTYINGTQVGQTAKYNEPRVYSVKPGLLKKGKNTIIVRVLDTGGGGGIYGKPEEVFLATGSQKISLAGEWFYNGSVLNTEFGIANAGPNSFPSLLYNAMIAPFIQYPVKGVIWYQGEANTGEAFAYRTLFKDLIADWRSRWGNDLSFYWVQLANFMAPDSTPAQSDWAELREAQNMTLSLPGTGQAVAIDIGEATDIHPRNKQDVGLRLALAALKTTYGKNLVHSGPVYKSMEKKGDRIVLSFSDTGSGLWIKDKYGYVRGFSIAGNDQKFVWAKAYVEGDKVVVYSPDVKDPAAVRYAWGNNPDDANVYNREGLPASPFRTDTWPGITQRDK